MDSKRRTLSTIGAKAKEWRAAHLKQKYAPKDELDSLHLPSTDEVKGKLAMDSLAAQGEPNQALADSTLEENNRALSELDDDKLKGLLAGLR